MILSFFVYFLGMLIGRSSRFGLRVALEMSDLMQSSRDFQWRSGSPGQSNTPDGGSHLLLLLKATQLFWSRWLSQGAEGEDANC
jgi:hypothetical protein